MSGVYDKAENIFTSTRLLEDTLRKDVGTDRAVANATITLFRKSAQLGTLVENGGRYLRVDMELAGSPARSAKVCGKMVAVTGDDVLGAVQLSREEELRLGIGGKKWTGQSH